MVARSKVAALRAEAQAAAEDRQSQQENLMAAKIQNQWRRAFAVAESAKLKERENVMAAKLQAKWRSVLAMNELNGLRQEKAEAGLQNAMALKLQCQWRSVVATNQVKKLREAKQAALGAEKELENAMAVKLQCRWRSVMAANTVEELREQKQASLAARAQLENAMAVKLQSKWRCVLAEQDVAALRERQRVALLEQRQLEEVMALKIQSRWRVAVAMNELASRKETARIAAAETRGAVSIQSAWRGRNGRMEANLRRSELAARRSEEERAKKERPQIHRQPTLAELQLLSQTGRFSVLSGDSDYSDDDSDFEDARDHDHSSPPSVVAASALDAMAYGKENRAEIAPDTDSDQSSPRSEDENGVPQVPESALKPVVESASSGHAMADSDDASDASSDSFVDTVEEVKPAAHFPKVVESHSDHDNNAAFDTAPSSGASGPVSEATPPPSIVNGGSAEEVEKQQQRLSSISDFDRPSSVRSGSFFQEPSFTSDSPRDSFTSGLLGAESRSRDDSYASAYRSREDSYADIPVRGDDQESLSDLDEVADGPRYFDTDSDRGDSFASDSPGSGQNISDVDESDKRAAVHDGTDVRQKSGSRWRAASVLSKISSRQSSKNSSKQSSSPTSSLGEEHEQKKPRSGTLSSVAAALRNRKPSIPTSTLSKTSNASSSQSFESEIEESFVFSPPAQQAPKGKSRFGRFTAPSVAKPAFAKRFAWKNKSRRGTHEDENDSGDHLETTHAA
ncbi:hypothetical protein BBJ28_00017092 [Nothophytophthora sp. Chile5]|nr:hypothetical protein BBJ28_00017092 [Nothophytophthora sp. Chile5]